MLYTGTNDALFVSLSIPSLATDLTFGSIDTEEKYFRIDDFGHLATLKKKKKTYGLKENIYLRQYNL